MPEALLAFLRGWVACTVLHPSSASSSIRVGVVSLFLHESCNGVQTDADDNDKSANAKTSRWATTSAFLDRKLNVHNTVKRLDTWICPKRSAFSRLGHQVDVSGSLGATCIMIQPLLNCDPAIANINKEWGVRAIGIRSHVLWGSVVKVVEQFVRVDLLSHCHWCGAALIRVDLSAGNNILRIEGDSWSRVVLPQVELLSQSLEGYWELLSVSVIGVRPVRAVFPMPTITCTVG